jgi:hypothetical protein
MTLTVNEEIIAIPVLLLTNVTETYKVFETL